MNEQKEDRTRDSEESRSINHETDTPVSENGGGGLLSPQTQALPPVAQTVQPVQQKPVVAEAPALSANALNVLYEIGAWLTTESAGKKADSKEVMATNAFKALDPTKKLLMLKRIGINITEETTFKDVKKVLDSGLVFTDIQWDKILNEANTAKDDSQIDIVKLDKIIADKAAKKGKEGLIPHYNKLTKEQKITVAKLSGAPTDKETLDNPNPKVSIDWDKFSLAMRKENKNAGLKDIFNKTGSAVSDPATTSGVDLVSQGTDVTSYSGTLASVGIEGNNLAGGKEVGAVAKNGLGVALAPVAFVYDALNVYSAVKAFMDDKSVQSNTEAGMLMGGKIANALSAMTADIAALTNTIAALAGNDAVAATAGNLLAPLTIAAGAAKMVQGAYDWYQFRDAIQKLDKALETTLKDSQFKAVAQRAKMSLAVKKNMGIATAIQGAAMVAGGIALVVAAASPVGWILGGAAAAIGLGVYAYKYFKEKSDSKKFVTDTLDKAENVKTDKKDRTNEDLINKRVQKYGYNDFQAFHDDIVLEMASQLYNAAFGKDGKEKDEARTALEAMRFKIDEKGKKPNVDQIKAKLKP